MKKSYSAFWSLADDSIILSGRMVVCDQIWLCDEAMYCGGTTPHRHDPKECGHCPMNKEARCFPEDV